MTVDHRSNADLADELLTTLREAMPRYESAGLVAIAWLVYRPNKKPRFELSGVYSPTYWGSCETAWSPRPTRRFRFRRRLHLRGRAALSIGQTCRIERILETLDRRGVFEHEYRADWWEWDYDKYIDLNKLVITIYPMPKADVPAHCDPWDQVEPAHPNDLVGSLPPPF